MATSTSTMTVRGKAGVYAGAALLRLVLTLAFPGLPDLLTGRVEISTPVTSFKRCKRPNPRPNGMAGANILTHWRKI